MHVCANASESLLRDLRRGEFDLVVAASDLVQTCPCAAFVARGERVGRGFRGGAGRERPVPLAVLGETNLSRRLSVAALEEAGQPYEIAYVGGSFAGLVGAARAGLGVVCWPKRALRAAGLEVLDSLPPTLPRVPSVHAGVYLRVGLEGSPIEALADSIADAVGGPSR